MRIPTLLVLLAFTASHSAAQGARPGALRRDDRVRDSIAAAEGTERGLALLSSGRYDSAATILAQVVELRRRHADSAGLGRSLNSFGTAHYQMGQYEVALEAYLESLAFRRAIGDQVGVARVLTNIGLSYRDMRRYERALPVLEEALDVAEATGHPFALGYALTCLGELETELGRYAEARAHLERSMAIYDSGDPRITPDDSASGWALNTPAIALIDIRQGNPRAAIPRLQEMLRISRERDRSRGEARANLYLAEAYRALGDRPAALESARQALAIARRIEQRAIVLVALRQLTELEELAGDTRAALAYLRAYQALSDTVFDQASAQRIAMMETRAETQALQAERTRQAALIARQRLVGLLGGGALALGAVLLVQLVRANRRGRERGQALTRANAELERTNADLRAALSEVRTLKGLIPICARCKRIRDDQGFWEAVETYIGDRSEASFSHSICTHCGPELYGDAWQPPHESGSAPRP